jgi:hypothetical protein
MQGRRIYCKPEEIFPEEIKPGDYWRDNDGLWMVCPPVEGVGLDLIGCIQKHQIIEHEDKTITASPSVLIQNHRGTYHGFLVKGEWRNC